MLDLFQAGGPLFMIPLFLASVGVIAVMWVASKSSWNVR